MLKESHKEKRNFRGSPQNKHAQKLFRLLTYALDGMCLPARWTAIPAGNCGQAGDQEGRRRHGSAGSVGASVAGQAGFILFAFIPSPVGSSRFGRSASNQKLTTRFRPSCVQPAGSQAVVCVWHAHAEPHWRSLLAGPILEILARSRPCDLFFQFSSILWMDRNS